MSRVLFVCVANGGRSVLAERVFTELAHGRHEARSAGSEPGPHVHPVVVEALAELGIDAADHVPTKLDQDRIAWCDLIVSTCAEEACPVTYGKPRIRWEFPDPKDRPLSEVRETRDAIKRQVEALIDDLTATARRLSPAPARAPPGRAEAVRRPRRRGSPRHDGRRRERKVAGVPSAGLGSIESGRA